MISGGNATIITADMDRSIRFYTEILELKLTNRFGNDWATVSAGEGLTIGIHPASAQYPAPGTKGAIILGTQIYLWEKPAQQTPEPKLVQSSAT
jgi:catechol 2,3-dioxygenase-like lactoylglutathione lyase family enzyme